MSRSRFALLPIFVFSQLTACDPSPNAVAIGGDGGVDDALRQLEQDTGQSWLVRFHPDVHTPAFLEGRTAPLAATPSDATRAGRAFLTRYHGLFQMADPDDSVTTAGAETDELGMTHARFTQQKGKVPVWGGDLVMHFDTDGSLVRVNGRYTPIATMTLEPQKSADEARVAAAVDAHTLRADADTSLFTTKEPTLYVLPIAGAEPRLAWRVEVDLHDNAAPTILETLVDAETGAVLQRENLVDTLDGSGVGVFGDVVKLSITQKRTTYYLEDATRGGQETYTMTASGKLPGSEVKSVDPKSWDTAGDAAGAAVDAHANVAFAYDYFKRVHGRAGWDGKGTGPKATVHYGQAYNNAFFNGKQLVFGDGDGATFWPLSASADVVTHEYTHGVTNATAKLGHSDQPGALNEAVSDIFGCFATFNSGRGSAWQVGETVYHPGGAARALRDIANPHASSNPASMAEYVQTVEDQGGVHVNSTIVSHAAYLLTQGSAQMTGLGVADAQKIWYRALTHYLTSRATFRDAADATISAAHDLKRGEASVRQAWIAVGVLSE